MTQILLHGQEVESVFQLLGDKENDISYSVAWVLSRCERFLGAFLESQVGSKVDLSEVVIELQHSEKKGGNSALEAVLDLLKVAEHVDMVSVTPLTGDPILIQKVVEAKNLTIYKEYQTEKILGQTIVEGIVVKDIKTGNTKQLDVTGIFIEIGLVPNSDMVKDLVKLTPAGEIPINASCETEIPGLFAAGDVSTVPEKQIVIAAGEGAKAALAAHHYLRRLAK